MPAQSRRDPHIQMRHERPRTMGLNSFACTHCGEELFYHLPLRMETWLGLRQVFRRVHRGCRAPTPGPGP
jgi:hypothetical protein